MTERADVVVIGGGVSGVMCAHHLHERGADVLVLERDGIAQATSTCGAGFIGQWAGGWVRQWGAEELACERYGLEFYRALHDADPSFSYHANGALFVTTTAKGWDEHLVPLAECDGVPDRRIVGPAEIEQLTGLVRAGDESRGVYHPGGVQLTARDAIQAAARRLAERGARIHARRPATRLTVRGGRAVGVETTQGPVAAGTIVVAAAMWSNALLDGAAGFLAQAPLGALRITTEPVAAPSTMPMLLFPEFDHAWLREDDGGRLLWGCAYGGAHRNALLDVEPLPERVEQLPMDGVFATLSVGQRLAATIPALARYQQFTMAQGAPCYTPDLRALIGPSPGLDGLYVLTGDNEAGVTHGPGYGRALAELISGETPFVDLAPFRIDRFGDRFATAREVAAAIANDEQVYFQ